MNKQKPPKNSRKWFIYTIFILLISMNCNFIYNEFMNNDFNFAIEDPYFDDFEDNSYLNSENQFNNFPEVNSNEILPPANQTPFYENDDLIIETDVNGFAYKVTIFGVSIYASENVQLTKLTHAATILAEYLDNDENSIPDNSEVIAQLVAHQAAIVMFADERDEENFDIEALMQNKKEPALSLLYAHETHPEGSSYGAFDASLEEILHLITQWGYAYAYPEVWGEHPGSAVADAMDYARGGQFEQVPASYTTSAWFTYDDPTCEYDCQIAEYIYWSLTSLLGAQQYPGRLEEIEHEWQPNTPEKLRQLDPTIYALLTDSEYQFPDRLPEGHYDGFNITLP